MPSVAIVSALVYCVSAIVGVVSFFYEQSVILIICGVYNALMLLVRLITKGDGIRWQMGLTFACFIALPLISPEIFEKSLLNTAMFSICAPTALQSLLFLPSIIFAPLNRRADQIDSVEKSVFEKYYHIFLSHRTINGKKYCREITAAYLFVVSDFLMSSKDDYDQRAEIAKKNFLVLEKDLFTKEQLDRFDKIVILFSAILREDVFVRGDWCLLKNETREKLDPIQRVFFCYGDLICLPDYIEEYENLPLEATKDHILDWMGNFAPSFMELHDLTKEYINQLNSGLNRN